MSYSEYAKRVYKRVIGSDCENHKIFRGITEPGKYAYWNLNQQPSQLIIIDTNNNSLSYVDEEYQQMLLDFHFRPLDE